jgi:hypothetical protein
MIKPSFESSDLFAQAPRLAKASGLSPTRVDIDERANARVWIEAGRRGPVTSSPGNDRDLRTTSCKWVVSESPDAAPPPQHASAAHGRADGRRQKRLAAANDATVNEAGAHANASTGARPSSFTRQAMDAFES